MNNQHSSKVDHIMNSMSCKVINPDKEKELKKLYVGGRLSLRLGKVIVHSEFLKSSCEYGSVLEAVEDGWWAV